MIMNVNEVITLVRRGELPHERKHEAITAIDTAIEAELYDSVNERTEFRRQIACNEIASLLLLKRSINK